MSKQIQQLMKQGLGAELSSYMSGVKRLETIKNCVDATRIDSNVYQTIASFESAGIVSTHAIPTGSAKVKLNYLLTEAIEQAASQVIENFKLSVDAIKAWEDVVIVDNQKERLNVAIDKLGSPVKFGPIPPYSQMESLQRNQVQVIFQRSLGKQEPLEINFITEALDRYNAGASNAVMFKALDLRLDYKNAVSVYDQDSYATLMNDDTFMYMLSRLESYEKLAERISTATQFTAIEMADMISNSGFAKNVKAGSAIKEALSNLDFMKPAKEYEGNLKNETTYEDLKSFTNGTNKVKALDHATVNRINALCGVVKRISSAPVLHVQKEQSELDNEKIYEALASYFDLMDELTNNLLAFMFITQIAVRNNTLVEDVIVAIDKACVTIETLFKRVDNLVTTDGQVSQESINLAINKIKAVDVPESDKLPMLPQLQSFSNFMSIQQRYVAVNNQLMGLKLRDTAYISPDNLKAFKAKHAKAIKRTYGTVVGGMDEHELFEFMTNKITTTPLSKGIADVFTAEAYNLNKPLSTAVMKVIWDADLLTQTFVRPLELARGGYYDCMERAFIDKSQLIKKVYPEYDESADISAGQVVDLLEDRLTLDTPSYNQPVNLFNKIVSSCEGIKCKAAMSHTSPRTRTTYTLRGTQLDSSSQHALIELFVPKDTASVSLKSIYYHPEILSACKQSFDMASIKAKWDLFLKDEEKGYPKIKYMYDNLKAADGDITDCLESLDASQEDIDMYKAILNCLTDDAKDTLDSIKFSNKFVELLNSHLTEATTSLHRLYVEFIDMAQDFIQIAK